MTPGKEANDDSLGKCFDLKDNKGMLSVFV